MKKTIFFAHALAVLLVGTCMMSCREEMAVEARYTFNGQTVAQYLEDNEELFSDFIEILQRGEKWSLMKAYGTYTCFAPTNDAVRRYLVEQDSIWRASLLPGSKKEMWTGVTSPELSELSDSMCEVIAKTHLLNTKYLTMEMDADVIPSKNMYFRHLTLRNDVDENKHSVIYVNDARIVSSDNEVENGVVHVISAVMSSSSRSLGAQIGEMPFLSIFYDALLRTGLDEALEPYMDYTYNGAGKWRTNMGGGQSPFPAYKYYGFTAFCEPDDVFNKEGIYNVDDLYEQSKKWYPDATDPDFKSKNNALNKFVSYHLLDRKLLYSRFVQTGLKIYKDGHLNFDSEEFNYSDADRYDYFETMQGTMLKVILPRSNGNWANDNSGVRRHMSSTMFLNYGSDAKNSANPFNATYGDKDVPVNVMIMNPTDVRGDTANYRGFSSEAMNGSIHLITRPLVYDDDAMLGYVLNEPIRIDAMSLCPELTNNDLRWSTCQDIEYEGSVPIVAIPPGYCENYRYNTDETYVFCVQPNQDWEYFQGDNCYVMGAADLSVRMPHVPPGTYELRYAYGINSWRGIIQFYVDDVITGIPIDLRINATDPRIGYVSDYSTPDMGVTNDKEMKNRGYVKPPTCYKIYGLSARRCTVVIRRVLVTKFFSEGDHWLRIKNVSDRGGGEQCNFDYLELVPIGWLRREDISTDDRRL